MELEGRYNKIIERLGNVKVGELVFDDRAELCVVGEDNTLHSYGTICSASSSTFVYPVTLASNMIAEKIREYRKKFSENKIMNPYFSNVLSKQMHILMCIDDNKEDSYEEYEKVYKYIDGLLNECILCAKKLHII